jgi:hypothetical protein
MNLLTERDFARKFVVCPENYNTQVSRIIDREIEAVVIHGVTDAVLRRTVGAVGPVLTLAVLVENVAEEFIESSNRTVENF